MLLLVRGRDKELNRALIPCLMSTRNLIHHLAHMIQIHFGTVRVKNMFTLLKNETWDTSEAVILGPYATIHGFSVLLQKHSICALHSLTYSSLSHIQTKLSRMSPYLEAFAVWCCFFTLHHSNKSHFTIKASPVETENFYCSKSSFPW